MPDQEPCLCGDPFCLRCFPQYYEEDEDQDSIDKARRIDDELEAKSEEPTSSSKVER